MKNQSSQLLIQLGLLLLTFIFSKTLFKAEYLFGWINHNHYFYIGLCIIALVIGFFNKKYTSLLMTLALTVGLFASNYLGKYHRLYNISKITNIMDAEKVANLHLNYAFSFWMGIIFFSLLVGFSLDLRK